MYVCSCVVADEPFMCPGQSPSIPPAFALPAWSGARVLEYLPSACRCWLGPFSVPPVLFSLSWVPRSETLACSTAYLGTYSPLR